jgi:hypothetical protein
MPTETKRQNFNITPEQEAEIAWLRDAIGASSAKEAILRAVRVLALLVDEARQGRALYLGTKSGRLTELLIPEIASIGSGGWKYLVARPHPWRRQLFVKGRKLRAFTVWMDMQANRMSPEDAVENWDLPLEAIEEIIRYCESHKELLEMEADEERRRLIEEGLPVEPPAARR